MTTITITKRNGDTITVDSPYTDITVVAALRAACEHGRNLVANDFAQSLNDSSYGPRGMSQNQLAWAHILVVQAEEKVVREWAIEAAKIKEEEKKATPV